MMTNIDDMISQMNKEREMHQKKGLSDYSLFVAQDAPYDDISRAMWFTDSYTRIHFVLQAYRPHEPDFFRFLGEHWDSCDNLHLYRDELLSLLNRYKHHTHLMMGADDLQFYNTLPDKVTVYRGQDAEHEVGLSWTLDKQIAVNFATKLTRYRCKNPILLTADIEFNQIFAVKLGRNEQEVICSPNTLKYERLG